MKHKLEADSIQLEFKAKKVLSDIYLKCTTGSIIGLLGRNGEGKSCLMNIIYGSLDAGNQSVRFDNKVIRHAYKRPDLLAYLPQFNFIPKSLSVKRVLSDFELSGSIFENHFPEFRSKHDSPLARLSVGQRRLVEVYAIIKSRSNFALLDEPFSHLSPLQIEKIKGILISEKNERGFLITDHMYRHIFDVCDNLYVLVNGKAHLIRCQNEIEKLGYISSKSLIG